MLPTLYSERLILSAFLFSDAQKVKAYAGDPAVAETTANVPHPYPEGAAEKWIASHALQFLDGKNIVLAIRSHETELLGAINLGLTATDNRGEIGPVELFKTVYPCDLLQLPARCTPKKQRAKRLKKRGSNRHALLYTQFT